MRVTVALAGDLGGSPCPPNADMVLMHLHLLHSSLIISPAWSCSAHRAHACTHTCAHVCSPELPTQAVRGSAFSIQPQGSCPPSNLPDMALYLGPAPDGCFSSQKQFFQLSSHLFSFSSMLLLFAPLPFPFLTGLNLQILPNFRKKRNCFQVRLKQTRSLEKIKNNEFLSLGLFACLSPRLPPFISLQKRKINLY